jgi:hypothetical protein
MISRYALASTMNFTTSCGREARVKKYLSKLKWSKPRFGLDLPDIDLGAAFKSGVDGAAELITGGVGSSVDVMRTTLGKMPFLGSTASSEAYEHAGVDEKHYFLVPDTGSETGYSLHIMRCLPMGVPPINELPKRRMLHLSSSHALPLLQSIVSEQAKADVRSAERDTPYLASNLNALIDEIDAVDGKLFNGVLLIGGLVAFVNPVAGAAVALKAVLPSAGLIVSRYGLKFASDTVTNLDLAAQVRRAEKDVAKQFKEANTVQLVNPLLAHMQDETDLGMWMMDRDAFAFGCEDLAFSRVDVRRLVDLTRAAISDVSGEAANDAYLDALSEIVISNRDA